MTNVVYIPHAMDPVARIVPKKIAILGVCFRTLDYQRRNWLFTILNSICCNKKFNPVFGMNKFIFIIVLLFSCKVLNAQISGVIIDEKKQPVEFATIRLYQIPDSVLIASTISNNKGYFSFPNAVSQQLILKISSVGYETIYLSAKSHQEITLKRYSEELQEVVISAREIETFGSKDKLLIPQSLKERASSALAALGEMPQFQLNRISNILQTTDRQNIFILIDGIQANENELMALPAKKNQES